jgi:similar to stage IV sporulation protein
LKKNNKIWIRIDCNNYYKLINKLSFLNINIYNIKKINENYYLLIDENNFKIINNSLVTYKLIRFKNTGFKKYLLIVKNYYIYFLTIIIGLLMFFILNHLIISIDVITEKSSIKELVTTSLKEKGIKVLSFRKSYSEVTKIKEEILNENQDKLDWLEIENHGMKYVIKVSERIINVKENINNYCNVIALSDGLVSDIKINKGVSLIKRGDYVKKGDTLITGDIIYNNELKTQVCASGEVYAEKWYTVNINLPLKYLKDEQTGKKKYNLIWQDENNEFQLLKPRLSTYTSKKTNLFDIFSKKLILETEYEINKKEYIYTEEEAISKALDLAEEKIKIKLSNKDTLIDKKVLKKDLNNSTMDIEIFVVTNELISN